MADAARSAQVTDGWRRTGAAFLVLTGLGHLATEALVPATPERDAMIAAMKSWHVAMPGAARSMWDFHHGFSLTMGLLLVACGALILQGNRGRRESWLAFVIAVAIAACSWSWFFAVPGVLTSCAAACFGVMVVRDTRRARPSHAGG